MGMWESLVLKVALKVPIVRGLTNGSVYVYLEKYGCLIYFFLSLFFSKSLLRYLLCFWTWDIPGGWKK